MLKKIFAIVAAIALIAVLLLPAYAATFPDNLVNVLDCNALFTLMNSRLGTALITINTNAATGTIEMTPTSSDRDYIATNYLGYITDICPEIKADVWYTFHYEQDNNGSNTQFAINWENYSRTIKNGDVFKLTTAELTTRIFITAYNIKPQSNTRTISHLAIIPSALPLSGSFTDQTYPTYFNIEEYEDTIYENGYDEGYQEGWEASEDDGGPYERGYNAGHHDGYLDGLQGIVEAEEAAWDQGYAAGVEEAGSNIFHYATATAKITYTDGTPTSEIDFYLNEAYGTAWFMALKNNNAITQHENTINTITINLTWQPTRYWDWTAYEIFISGSGQINNSTIISNNNETYTLSYEQGSGIRQATISPGNYNVLIVKTYQINIPKASLDTITLYSGSQQYSAGFTQGQVDGYERGKNDGIIIGGQNKYNQEVVDNAYYRGYEEGLTLKESGDWRELISSVVETPANTLMSMFNFEILGMDMQKAIGSILAICLLLIIIKKATGK